MSRARWAFVLLAVCAATLPEAAQAAKLIGLTYSERRRPCLPASMACRLVAGPHACDAAGNTPEGGKAAEREPLCRAWPANRAGPTPPPPPCPQGGGGKVVNLTNTHRLAWPACPRCTTGAETCGDIYNAFADIQTTMKTAKKGHKAEITLQCNGCAGRAHALHMGQHCSLPYIWQHHACNSTHAVASFLCGDASPKPRLSFTTEHPLQLHAPTLQDVH